MATAVESLLIRIDATTETLRRELRQAEQATGRFQQQTTSQLRRVDSAFDRTRRTAQMANRVLAAFGAGLSIAALSRFARGAFEMADEFDKTATTLGLSTAALQEFQHVASLSSVSASDFRQAIEHLNRQIGAGAVPYRTAEEALTGIADRLAATADAGERARIAQEAFGRSGARLLPMLNEGSAGLARMRQEAHELGLVLDDQAIRGAVHLNDELTRLMRVLTVNAQSGLLSQLVGEADDLRSIYTDPAFQAGARAIGETVGFVATEAAAAVRTLGLLVGLASDPSIESLRRLLREGVGAIRLGRGGAEALGLIERAAEDAAEAVQKVFDAAVVDTPALAMVDLRPVIDDQERQLEAADRRRQEAMARRRQDALGTIDSITEAWMSAHGMEAQLVHKRTADQLAALRAMELSETEFARAKVMVNEIAALRIGEIEQRRMEAALQAHRQAMGELERLFDRSFDRIGGSITEMFVRGEGAAVNFRNVVGGVISEIYQDFLRLALLNPLRNMLFGGAAPTLAGLFAPAAAVSPLAAPTAGFSVLPPMLPSFDTGGVVPGPRGAPTLAVVHGGETVLPTHKGAAGVSINQTFSFAAGASMPDHAEMRRFAEAIKRETFAAVVDARRRDPALFGSTG